MSAGTEHGVESGTKLSVIIPTLDEADTLPGLLDSLSGACAPEEVLVVDGGSEDETHSVARAGGARILSAARGRGRQLGSGADRAEGDLLLFLHADALLRPGALLEIRRAFRDPRVIASGMRQAIDHPARFYRWVEAAANARARRGLVYGDSGLCVRREAYRKAGGFRDLALFEDFDLSRRLRPLGTVVFLEQATLEVSARRWEAEGRLRRTFLNWALTAAYLCGVPSARLVRYYPKARHADRDSRTPSGEEGPSAERARG